MVKVQMPGSAGREVPFALRLPIDVARELMEARAGELFIEINGTRYRLNVMPASEAAHRFQND